MDKKKGTERSANIPGRVCLRCSMLPSPAKTSICACLKRKNRNFSKKKSAGNPARIPAYNTRLIGKARTFDGTDHIGADTDSLALSFVSYVSIYLSIYL